MRKLSFGPLLILLVVYLWTHFASAAEVTTVLPAKKGAVSSLTESADFPVKKSAAASSNEGGALPAKKVVPANSRAAGPAANVAAVLPAKRSAVSAASRSKLATALPAKKTSGAKKSEVKFVQASGDKAVEEALVAKKTPSKKVAVALPAKKRVVVVTASGVAKTLPAKTKVVMNFDQPALPAAEAVVVREVPTTMPMTENEVEEIRRHDVTEAATLTLNEGPQQSAPIEIPNTAPRKLRPALPDSDSFVALPAGLKRAGPQVVVEQPRSVVQPRVVVAQPEPETIVHPVELVGPPAPVAALSSPTVANELVGPPAPPSLSQKAAADTTSATTAAPADDDGLDLNLQTTTLPSDIPMDTTSDEAIRAEHEQRTESVREFIGPLAPLVNTQARVDITRNQTEAEVDHEKGTRGDSYETHVAPAISTTFLIPHDEIPKRRIFIRGGYLNAQYDKLESDLKNGATTFGVSASQVFSKTEVRIGIDIAHGLDQEVTLRNTRMAMFRAEGLYNVWTNPNFGAYVGGALGGATIDVNSYRQSQGSDITIRENAKGTALLAAPEVGARARIGRQVSLDITLQYLLLAGSEQISNLGGLLGEAAVGFRF